jgi:hypothetical protein
VDDFQAVIEAVLAGALALIAYDDAQVGGAERVSHLSPFSFRGIIVTDSGQWAR